MAKKIKWVVGDHALTREDCEVTIRRIVTEDGTPFAWISYDFPADEPEGEGYITPGVWEHGLYDRECWSPRYHTGQDGRLVQEIVTSQERGLRRITPIELTLDGAAEIIDQFEESRAEAYAEAGSGAMSLGYGQDGAYEAANAVTARWGDGGRRVRAARAKLAEYTEPPAPVLTPNPGDIPF